jgi:hypothetical protein
MPVATVCDLDAGYRGDRRPPTASYDEVLGDPSVDAVISHAAGHALFPGRSARGGQAYLDREAAGAQARRLPADGRAGEGEGNRLIVDHTFLYDRAIRMRFLIAGGEMGEVHHVFLQRLNLGRIKRDSNVWWNSAPHDVSILLYLLKGRPASVTLHGYRYLQPDVEDLNMAVVEMSDGASAFIYHNWLFPENTAKLTVIGSKKMLAYEGKFDKRAATLHTYATGAAAGGAGEDAVTIPSKMIAERARGVASEGRWRRRWTIFGQHPRARARRPPTAGFPSGSLRCSKQAKRRSGGRKKISIDLEFIFFCMIIFKTGRQAAGRKAGAIYHR